MIDLQVRIAHMLAGEQKRRAIASTFIGSLESSLLPVSHILWDGSVVSSFDEPYFCTVVPPLSVSAGGDDVSSARIYFRYVDHHFSEDTEFTGFYFFPSGSDDLLGGSNVFDSKGPLFWFAVRTILAWIPSLFSLMDSKSVSRDLLLSSLPLVLHD